MNEKQAIERGTAQGFLFLYNERCGTDFMIVEVADALTFGALTHRPGFDFLLSATPKIEPAGWISGKGV